MGVNVHSQKKNWSHRKWFKMHSLKYYMHVVQTKAFTPNARNMESGLLIDRGLVFLLSLEFLDCLFHLRAHPINKVQKYSGTDSEKLRLQIVSYHMNHMNHVTRWDVRKSQAVIDKKSFSNSKRLVVQKVRQLIKIDDARPRKSAGGSSSW